LLRASKALLRESESGQQGQSCVGVLCLYSEFESA
jgi:hypothetical protein